MTGRIDLNLWKNRKGFFLARLTHDRLRGLTLLFIDNALGRRFLEPFSNFFAESTEWKRSEFNDKLEREFLRGSFFVDWLLFVNQNIAQQE